MTRIKGVHHVTKIPGASRIRKLPIANAMSGNQKVQSLSGFHGAILGRFSNTTAVAVRSKRSRSILSIMMRSTWSDIRKLFRPLAWAL